MGQPSDGTRLEREIAREAYTEELLHVARTREVIRLRFTAAREAVCPVCGHLWPPGGEHAWLPAEGMSESGHPFAKPSYSICDSCNTEFGNDDVPGPGRLLAEAWAALRNKWLSRVGRNDQSAAQLKNLGLTAFA